MSELITIDTGVAEPTATRVKLFEPYKLVEEHEKVLKTKCSEFDFSSRTDAKEISGRLTETLKLHRAYGIAAPQCGISDRVIVIGAEDEYIVMFNPVILYKSDETVHLEEGCLSFPFMTISITRPKTIRVKFQTVDGERKELTFDGISSRIVQHEIDHIDGITFNKVAKPLALKMALKKREKQIKQFARNIVSQRMIAQ